MELVFKIEPVPKLRARIGGRGAFTPTKSRKFEKQLQMLALNALQGKRYLIKTPNQAICVDVKFFLRPPKKLVRPYPSVRPDIDNYLKAVLDALNGILWVDDGCIVKVSCVKLYSSREPFIVLKVTDAPDMVDALG
jgi:Holliday junction resolvase RusA-like endonuclease